MKDAMYFVCYSPMRSAVAPLNAHVFKTRDDHSDFGADIKLHGNGGPLAIPNPYSSSRLYCLILLRMRSPIIVMFSMYPIHM